MVVNYPIILGSSGRYLPAITMYLVGGFNTSEKYESVEAIIPNEIMENAKCCKLQTSYGMIPQCSFLSFFDRYCATTNAGFMVGISTTSFQINR